MATGKQLRVTVITPARSVFDEDAAAVVVPAFDGELGVLPGHAALLALLGNGPLRITKADGTQVHLAVRGGFLQVKENAAAILTPECAKVDELDAKTLDAEITKLNSEQATKLEARESLAQRMAWARARRKVLEASRGEHRN